MKTKIWAIIMMIFTTVLTSTAQIFYKTGVNSLELSFLGAITNYWIIIGLVLYAFGAGLMITAFKGGELSVLYPIIATSYIWVALLSFFIFHEAINIIRWAGIISIVFGVIFVGIGGKEII